MMDVTSDVLPDSQKNVMARGTLTTIQKCCLALYVAALACAATLAALFLRQHRDYNSPEYLLDTDHLRWMSPIPAVSVCQLPDSVSYAGRIHAGAVTSTDLSAVTEFLNGLVMPDKRYCVGCDRPCSLCPRDDYRMHVDKATLMCESLFKRCVRDETEFDCCENFKLLSTKGGKCFSINSQQSNRSGMSEELSVSSRSKQAVMKLTFNVPVQVYLHDKNDVGFTQGPSKRSKKPTDTSETDKKGQRTEITYRYYEVGSDASVRGLTPQQRRCVLPDERQLAYHRTYSQSACRAECRMRKQLAVCNCTHHLLPMSEIGRACDIEGLKCLDHHFRDRLKDTKQRLRQLKVLCDCPPGCDVTEINIVHSALTETEAEEISAVITLQSPPTQRLTLTARVSWLDVLVGVACISRLFTAASLPSVVRNLYHVARQIRYRRSGRSAMILPDGAAQPQHKEHSQ